MAVVVVTGLGAVARGCWCWLRRSGGECGEGGAASFAGARRGAGGGAPGVVLLLVVPGVQGALVADGEQAGQPEHERGEAGQADPAAVDAVDGGVLDRGVEPFGRGEAGVGDPPRLRGVVV